MGQTHIQTRVPDTLAEEIEEYQENGDYMNRAEALRALLRAGLDAESATKADGQDPADGRTIDALERGYWLSKLLSDLSLPLLMIALGAWLVAYVGLIPAGITTIAVTALFLLAGSLAAVSSLILAVILRTAEAIAGVTIDHRFSRTDIRRVIMS